jgi:hypothetical protein
VPRRIHEADAAAEPGPVLGDQPVEGRGPRRGVLLVVQILGEDIADVVEQGVRA